MSSQPNRAADEGDDQQIISPFASTFSTIRLSAERTKGSWPLWIVSGLLVLVLMGIAGYFLVKYINDPYRTLESFSADKYFDDYRPLAGAKFQAEMKVVADLGWKENVGRLMVFNEGNDSRPVLVMIPPKLAGVYFTKGQSYQMALEVGEGGLIYADTCDKE